MIRQNYLLALDVAIARGPDGSFHADPSWARDLLRHLSYIERLTYMAPVQPGPPPPGWVPLPADRMRIVGHPAPGPGLAGYLAALRLLPLMWREVGRAAIVHSGLAGHPIPSGWLAVPMARLRGRKLVMIVESAFWRVPPGEGPGRARRLRARLAEAIARFCLRQADYAAYAHADWQRELPAPRAGGGDLFSASWIEAEDVLAAEAVAERWAARIAASGPVRLLFAARLIRAKGTAVLAAAIERLTDRGVVVEIDVIGTGEDLAAMQAAAAASRPPCRMRVLDPVPYGPDFFALLRRYDAILAPSLSDEQPRIVFDAAAQGVPALASGTPGLRACIEDGVTGRLIAPGDPEALAGAVAEAQLDRLAAMGRAARDRAATNTHEHMHDLRARALAAIL
jgi:glycosyltransferase involved in cell wall biosynthesis